MFISLNVRWDSRLRSCYSLSANIFWSCVGLDYLAFLFVPTAANPSLSFHFLSFNMEHFLCLILVLLPFPFSLLPSLSLRHRHQISEVEKRLSDFKHALPILYSSSPCLSYEAHWALLFLRRALSLSLSFFLPSFHLTQGTFDVIVDCSACVCT